MRVHFEVIGASLDDLADRARAVLESLGIIAEKADVMDAMEIEPRLWDIGAPVPALWRARVWWNKRMR